MNRLFTSIRGLARNRKNVLLLRDYMLDEPHDALQNLTVSLLAAVMEGMGTVYDPHDVHGLLSVSGVAADATNPTRVNVRHVAAVVHGVPVVLAYQQLDTAGVLVGSRLALYAVADPVLSSHTVTDAMTREQLTHQLQTGAGRLRIVPEVPSSPENDLGAAGVLLATFTAGAGLITDLSVAAPTLSLRGLADLRAQLATSYAESNPVPLSTAFTAPVAVPDVVQRAASWGDAVPGMWAQITPAAPTYLAGVRLSNETAPNGEQRQLYLYRVIDGTLLATSPVSTVQGGAVRCEFAEPVQLTAGTAYRLAMRNPAGQLNSGGNSRPNVTPGFTVGASGIWWNAPALPSLVDDRNPGCMPWALLVSPGVVTSGVIGRLGRGNLPRSVAPLPLADGEAYILAAPGAAPELRLREGGTEYRLTGVPV